MGLLGSVVIGSGVTESGVTSSGVTGSGGHLGSVSTRVLVHWGLGSLMSGVTWVRGKTVVRELPGCGVTVVIGLWH